MTALTYAGIGARATPAATLRDMTIMAAWLARKGWHLASGGADGADSSFAGGAPAGMRTIYIPWRDYNGHRGADCHVLSGASLTRCSDVAAAHHPDWSRCSSTVRRLHARNAAILLGPSLDRPVSAAICWTPLGRVTGGTGMSIRIAEAYDIPVFNLATMHPRAVCERMLQLRG